MMHADALFCADEADAACVHASKCTAVHGEARRCMLTVRIFRGDAAVGSQAVVAGDEIHLPGTCLDFSV